MADKPKIYKVVSPIGIAQFPKLNEPDTKFKKGGRFEVTLILDPQDDEAEWMLDGEPQTGVQNFLDLLDKLADEAFKESKGAFKEAAKKSKKKLKFEVKRRDPYDLEVDDEQNETGKVMVKFGLDATYTKKGENGEPDKVYKKKVALFDSVGNPTTEEIWGGSKLRVMTGLRSYVVLGNDDAGCSKRLNAAQVIQLVTRGGGNAEYYGFGSVEGGYVREEQKDPAPDSGEDYGDEEKDGTEAPEGDDGGEGEEAGEGFNF